MKFYSKVWITVLTLAIAALATYGNLTTPPAHAAGPWYVAPAPTGNDGNACTNSGSPCATINGAIAKASSGDTIYVAVGTYTGSGNEVVLFNKNATLSGGWNAGFTTQNGMSTIDGEDSRRGIKVNSSINALIEYFNVQHGFTSDWGGGVSNDGTLTLNNSILNNNMVPCSAIENKGTFIINDSIISDNTGDGFFCSASAVINWGSGIMTLNNTIVTENMPDGGIRNLGVLTVNNSVIGKNISSNGNIAGGIDNFGGTLTLNNSTVGSNEISGIPGGGIYNYSGGTATLNSSTINGNTSTGISNDWNSTIHLNNSTVSNNSFGGNGGGIYNGHNSTLTLNNSTISHNTAWQGGGIFQDSGTVTLQNSILAGNTASAAGPDCNGTISSSGYNLIGDTSDCTFAPTTGDLTNTDPKLDPLEDNGGSTETHALLSGSPAINAGNPAGCTDNIGNPLSFDQRGMVRVGPCDIGAYEAGLAAAKQGEGIFGPGGLVTYTITIANEEGITDLTNVSVSDTLPIYHTYVPGSFSATNGTGGENNGIISWNGTVFAAAETSITFSAAISNSIPQGIVVTNTAVISSGGVSITRHASFNTFQHIYLPIILTCPALYTDDFSDSGSGWLVGDTGNSLREYLNGEFRILIRNVNWFTGSRSGFKASDYIVAVDVRNVTGVYGSPGLIFGVSDTWSLFYTFEIFPDGIYEIWRYNSGWTLLTSGSSGSINPGTATNRLKIERNGALIKAYANGQLLTTISDSTSTGLKQVGVGASTSNQPDLDVRFDNFEVYPLTCGPAATVLSGVSETPPPEEMGAGFLDNGSGPRNR